MSKSQEILELIDEYVENHVLMCSSIKDTGEQSAESIGYIEKSIDIREKLLAFTDEFEVLRNMQLQELREMSGKGTQ